eukprot:jgi/Astpho2/5997/Aster-03954
MIAQASPSVATRPAEQSLNRSYQDPAYLKPVTGPHVWKAKDFSPIEDHATWFTEEDLVELRAAVQQAIATGKELKDMVKEDFVLPSLGSKLVALRDQVVNGTGFVLLRGLPVGQWSQDEIATAYWGIGRHWGNPQSQNRLHHLLGHVKDIKPPGGFKNPVNRVYATHGAQPYHTDSSDMVALLCLKPAKEGGYSTWASSYSIYNAMLEKHPELAEVMTRDYYVDRKDEIPEGEGPWYKLPVFNFHKGRLIVYYENSFFRTAARHADVPEMTPQQAAAIEAFDALADSDELRIDYVLQPGDIQLLHNHSIVHARTEYTDFDASQDDDLKRHLMRLWISPENDWELPQGFASRWNGLTPGQRGGIVISGSEPRAPLDAEPYW